MKPVYFHSDDTLYKKFKLLCGINDTDVGKTLNGFMEKYVTENKSLIENPEVQEKLPPQLPSFYGDQSDWEIYIRKSDKNGIENVITRVTFLRYLLHIHLIDSDKDSAIKKEIMKPVFFNQSDDYKFLQKHRIIRNVKDYGNSHNLPVIGAC